MTRFINLLAVVPMRKEAAHRSEMVSQLLFGEYAELLAEEKEFVKVRCLTDGYEGWVQRRQLQAVDSRETMTRFTTQYTTRVLMDDTALFLPYGSLLPDGEGHFAFGPHRLSLVGDTWTAMPQDFDPYLLIAAYGPFVNTPYLWGGRSVFGIDCSGFVQQVYKFFGISLLRDAYLQAGQGHAVASVAEARPGDLAFFHNEQGKITHVGLVLPEGKIVHAAGQVRIDDLDERGIWTAEGEQSHQLHSIRRIVA